MIYTERSEARESTVSPESLRTVEHYRLLNPDLYEEVDTDTEGLFE
jgi:hypothetical protein